MNDYKQTKKFALALQKHQKELVYKIGKEIGFGNMMHLAQKCWRDILSKPDSLAPPGGEFACGPCVRLTVPCGCESGCDWCCGSRWLTKHVKKIKDNQ